MPHTMKGPLLGLSGLVNGSVTDGTVSIVEPFGRKSRQLSGTITSPMKSSGSIDS